MSKKKKIIISVIAVVLIIAVIVSAVVIAMTKGKNAKKSSGVYANKVSDVMYQAGSTDRYSGVVEAADSMDIKADSEKKVRIFSCQRVMRYRWVHLFLPMIQRILLRKRKVPRLSLRA